MYGVFILEYFVETVPESFRKRFFFSPSETFSSLQQLISYLLTLIIFPNFLFLIFEWKIFQINQTYGFFEAFQIPIGFGDSNKILK